MRMEFFFDKEKLKKEKLTEEKCLDNIRKYFNKYKSDTIREIKPGYFEGTDKDYGAFGFTAELPYNEWFLKVIKEWYWYIDEGDGFGEQKEDCLKSYYEVQ